MTALLLPIDIACNNPDNGYFDNCARAIQVDGDTLELEAMDFYGRAPRMVELADKKRFRLSGKTWRYVRVKYGSGNWCWNTYWLTLDDAVRFFTWLKRRHTFSVHTADTRLFQDWKSFKPLDQDLWFNVLDRVAGRLARA
jgi:hypothetical protein